MTYWRFLAVLGVAWFGALGQAAACSCITREFSVFEVLNEGGIVALGTPIEAETRREEFEGGGSMERVVYRFQVKKALNQRLPQTISVMTNRDSAACGAPLELGAETMLWLSPQEDQAYAIGLCSQLFIGAQEAQWRAVFDAMPSADSP